ncbi:phasin family protein [Paraburkholderia sp. 2C]
MTYFSTGQFTGVQQAKVDAMYCCAIGSFNGIDRFAALNMQTIRTLLDINQAYWQSALTSKEPQACFVVSPDAQPLIIKLSAHYRRMLDILMSMHASPTGQADAQHKRARKAQRCIGDAARSGRGPAEAVIAALDSVINQHAVRQPMQDGASGD